MTKVWNIDNPRSPSSPAHTSTRPDYTQPARQGTVKKQTLVGQSKPSKRVLAAYLFGPMAPVFWNTGRCRILWGVTAAISFVFVTMLLTVGSAISSWVLEWSGGVRAWLVIVPCLIIAFVTVWTFAIVDAVGRSGGSRYPRWLRNSTVVFLLGALVPGLGMRIAGHARAAARVFWIIAPLAATWVVLANWRALWERSQAAPAGLAGTQLEITFLVATGVGILSLVLWLIQALDGPRRLAETGSVVRSNVISAMLLLSLMAAAMVFQPATIAGEMYAASTMLRETGFRLIPLRLCETAARLDPTEPIYLSDAAELNNALGMSEAAAEKRHTLERRMRAYIEVVGRGPSTWHSAAASRHVIEHRVHVDGRSDTRPIVHEQ